MTERRFTEIYTDPQTHKMRGWTEDVLVLNECGRQIPLDELANRRDARFAVAFIPTPRGIWVFQQEAVN